MLTLVVTAQAGAPGLPVWQVAALFLGLPAALFLTVALLVLRLAPRGSDAFPVLRPAGEPEGAEPAVGDVADSLSADGAPATTSPEPDPLSPAKRIQLGSAGDAPPGEPTPSVSENLPPP